MWFDVQTKVAGIPGNVAGIVAGIKTEKNEHKQGDTRKLPELPGPTCAGAREKKKSSLINT
ncbi:hypothetical protein [Methylohalobius crimeensis]|uniref:hypothetical protein n=1 Tax=Methylohalobius crimeensis TaxID=244365 RepID=UPI0012690066|nr:hypothetical protein [Methylohalobius crimeensis]